MKAILEFDLNELDDKMAHIRCTKSLDMAIALWEIRCNLRKKCERIAENYKEQENGEDSDIFTGINIVLDQIGEILEENNINVDELIH